MQTTAELFGGKRCVIFGAFEPKVSEEYLKGFLEKHRDLKGSGAELIACISVNDPYVVKQWAQARYVGYSVLMHACRPTRHLHGGLQQSMSWLVYLQLNKK
jgi:2-Cys peroxiredoxin 5